MKSGNISISISDHLPSFFVKPNDNQNHIPKKQNLYTRNTKNFDRVNFLLDYFEINWDSILQANKNDFNLSMEIFMDNVNKLLDKYMPLRKITQREYIRRFKPWISDLILDKIQQKNKAFRKFKNYKRNPERIDQLEMAYKNIKYEISTLSRQGKKDYYKQYFTENAGNLRKIWKGIKEIINIKSKNYSHPTCIAEKGKTITDPKEMANSFNKYYASVADEILKERKYEGNKSHTEYLLNPTEQIFALYECNKTETENIIQTLSPRKAVGPNSIPTDILHLLKSEISYPLSIIFNISLRTGTHPELLKAAKVISIFRKGSQLKTSNYRPISLLSK